MILSCKLSLNQSTILQCNSQLPGARYKTITAETKFAFNIRTLAIIQRFHFKLCQYACKTVFANKELSSPSTLPALPFYMHQFQRLIQIFSPDLDLVQICDLLYMHILQYQTFNIVSRPMKHDIDSFPCQIKKCFKSVPLAAMRLYNTSYLLVTS